MIADIAWFGALLVAVLYAIFLLVCYVMFHRYSNRDVAPDFNRSVSVIVAARNEEHNIQSLLKSLDGQECSFPFEVIIVDDVSEDRTVQLANSYWPKKYSLSVHGNHGAGKKDALTTGVHVSQSEIILVTDADCIPDVHWVQRMARQFSDEQCCFVAGMVRPAFSDGAVGAALATEVIFLQVVSLGLFSLENPVMCNGASMGFTRRFFLDVQGFANDPYVSGDDVMLLRKAERYLPNGIRWLKDADAMVETQVAPDIRQAIHQRHRWLSKTKAHPDPVTNVIGIVFFANQLLLPAAFLAIFLFGFSHNPFWAGLIVKTVVELLLLSLAASFFRASNAIIMFPVSVFVYCVVSIGAMFRWMSGDVQWKGRNWKQGRV